MIQQFTKKELYKISFVLQDYVITEEQKLIRDNSGDRGWSELVEYETLITKIQMLITEATDV